MMNTPKNLVSEENLISELYMYQEIVKSQLSELVALRAVAEAAEKFHDNSYDYPDQTNFFVSDQKAFLASQELLKSALVAWRELEKK